MNNTDFKQQYPDDWEAFHTIWGLYKDYIDIEQGQDQRWETLIAEVDKMRLYENTLYVRLATAIVDELTVRSKEKEMREGRPC
jgi:hypothetical protein